MVLVIINMRDLVMAGSFCNISVSYTHLDVYKRQATYSGGKGNLDMTNEEDYVLVNGDFVMQSYNKHSDYLKARCV